MTEYKFAASSAVKFFRDHGYGVLITDMFVRLTKDGNKPIFKVIEDRKITLHANEGLPIPAWLVEDDLDIYS